MPFTTPNLQIGKDNVLFFENSRMVLKKRCHCAAEMQLKGYAWFDEEDSDYKLWWECVNKHEERLTLSEQDLVEFIEESFEDAVNLSSKRKSLLEFV